MKINMPYCHAYNTVSLSIERISFPLSLWQLFLFLLSWHFLFLFHEKVSYQQQRLVKSATTSCRASMAVTAILQGSSLEIKLYGDSRRTMFIYLYFLPACQTPHPLGAPGILGHQFPLVGIEQLMSLSGRILGKSAKEREASDKRFSPPTSFMEFSQNCLSISLVRWDQYPLEPHPSNCKSNAVYVEQDGPDDHPLRKRE